MTVTAETGTMRRVAQPGPAAAERVQWVEGRGRAFTFTLQPGLSLLEAVQRGFAAAGFTSGVVTAKAGALSPFAYVMPALSKDGRNAAFYSETYRPGGVTRLTLATMTLGRKDGASFMHCHALWTEADGRSGGGHVLAEQSVVAEPFEVEAFGFDGAIFTVAPDAETNFSLFSPMKVPAASDAGSAGTTRAFAMRLLPNQDFAGAMEGFCRQQGIRKARIRGGVGSTIGARFTDGRSVEPFATELAIRSGRVAPAEDGSLQAEIEIGLVDYTGGLAEGQLARGDNPVLMTMELVLEVA